MKLSRSARERTHDRWEWFKRYKNGVDAYAWLPTFLEDTGQWVWLEPYVRQLFGSYDKGWIFKNYSKVQEHLK